MKSYSNSTLTNDDLLNDVKRHAGQLEFILRECETRGIQSHASAIIGSYLTLATVLPPRPVSEAAKRAAEKITDHDLAESYAAFNLPVPRRMPPESFTEQRRTKRVEELAAIIESELTKG